MNPETLDAHFLQALLSLRFEFDEKAFLRSRRLLLSYRSLGPDILRCRGATHLKSVLYSFGTLLGAFISINFAFFRFSDRAIIKDGNCCSAVGNRIADLTYLAGQLNVSHLLFVLDLPSAVLTYQTETKSKDNDAAGVAEAAFKRAFNCSK
jgi:hypothetical protein